MTDQRNLRTRQVRGVALSMALLASLTGTLLAQDAQPRRILIINVHVFDGKSEQRIENAHVLVEGNVIKQVSTEAIAATNATVIDGGGRTLMPGLIDNHWHSMFAAIPQDKLLNSEIGYINLVASQQSRETLLRGFTSVRDVGGPVFGLKQAIDEGLISGPATMATNNSELVVIAWPKCKGKLITKDSDLISFGLSQRNHFLPMENVNELQKDSHS